MIDPSPIRLFTSLSTALLLAFALPGQGKQAGLVDAKAGRSVTPGKSVPLPKPRPEFPIAVVDVGKAAVHTKAMKVGRENMKRMHTLFKQSLATVGKELETLDLEISMMNNPSPQKMAKQIELAGLVREQEASKKLYDAALSRKRSETDNAVYREIEAALAQLAKRNGILLVLRKRTHHTVKDVVEQGGTEAEALSRQVSNDRLRDVLFHAAAIDLTDDLIKYLKG